MAYNRDLWRNQEQDASIKRPPFEIICKHQEFIKYRRFTCSNIISLPFGVTTSIWYRMSEIALIKEYILISRLKRLSNKTSVLKYLSVCLVNKLDFIGVNLTKK